jgi:hypothetical protein
MLEVVVVYWSWNFFEVFGQPRYAKDEADIKTHGWFLRRKHPVVLLDLLTIA